MATELDATLQFVEGMAFSITSGSGHQITIDAGDADGGQNQGPTPMELILMGTAGCTAMDVIFILRKKRQEVTAYQVHIHGTRAPTHPMVFTPSPSSMSSAAIISRKRRLHAPSNSR
jgi:putative redox protein